MPYHVVNAGGGRSTHIIRDRPGHVYPMRSQLGYGARTLCGLTASRVVDVFTPAEASCRECKKRWQLEVAAEAAKTPEQRRAEKVNAWVGAVVIFAVVIAVTIYMVAHGHH